MAVTSRLKRGLSRGVGALALGLFCASSSLAAPQGGSVLGGAAGIAQVGATTTIQQTTDRAIIRWDSFDVGAAERVDFVQPSASSITLNRIADSKPSQIDGHVTANGTLLLVNPNGVLFGSGSQIDVGGLVTATADVSDDTAFMAGGPVLLGRAGNSDASIINAGTITAKDAGLVGLIAPNVENHGTITARLGKASLVSGDTATLDLAGDGLIQIAISDNAAKQLVKNTGTIRADGGVIELTAASARQQVDSLIRNEGTLASARVGAKTGRITLSGSTSGIQNIGTMQAESGSVALSASFLSLGGNINADGDQGGVVSLFGSTITLADYIGAQGLAGAGGHIDIHSLGNLWETSTSQVNASGATSGGSIFTQAGYNYTSSGHYGVLGYGGAGGTIDLTGGAVILLSAQLDASGLTSGGRIRVGGEYQGGKNLAVDEMPNAQIVTVDKSSQLTAQGVGNAANGGTVIVWSDMDTMVLGNVNATPGLLAGDGGFVEISSGGNLSYAATVATGSGNRLGSVLLDPKNIIIASSTFNPTAIILGRGISAGASGNNVNISNLNFGAGGDFGAYGVSLDGNRMAVGNIDDQGADGLGGRDGAVYLYSFTDSVFSGAVLEGIMGRGYTGGKNVNVPLDTTWDRFGSGVSLDGNRIAIGAFAGDGATNGCGDCGEVYLYTFTDAAFNGAVLQGRIGHNYTGGKNFNMAPYLNSSDLFGWSVSLDGNRLAVSARDGDGLGNTVNAAGEVYLFSFADSVFSTPTLEAIIGNGYTGGKNINYALDANDRFGSSVSLSGNRLAVGSQYADGAGNAFTDSGEVALFSFTNSVFSGGVLEAVYGNGYTGGKNQNIALGTFDYFGTAVALDGNRLAIGAWADDGNGNTSTDSGAVYLYSYTDAVFNGATLEARIGNNYAALGGKNLSRPNEASSGDYFGRVLDLNGNRLVVGAPGDDGPTTTINSQQGAYHFYTFSDAVFTGGTYQGTLGTAYTGGKNITLPFNSAPDSPSDRMSVSLDGTRLAIGLPYADGFNDTVYDSGEVYLYTFANTNFDSAVLEGMIGAGYTGGKNVDVSGQLGFGDGFGHSVSLDGNRLAVGAMFDDGNANALGDSGAVYLFTFSDSVFTGGALQARLGYNYGVLGGKNFSVTNIGSSDWFGSAVSLDGNRLAVSAPRDDGNANSRTDSGAVYLFSFADSAFTTPTLESIIGYGYTGGKNYNLNTLDTSDILGEYGGVALDGNRLAVTARGDDGFGNTLTDAGAAYLFTFADSVFTTPTLQATMGYGYTGGKNINMSMLEASDYISGVALEGSVLALGASRDDGYGNSSGDSGAVYLYNFNDLAFSGGALDATIGVGYTGGKNINTSGLQDSSDYLGVSLDLSQGSLVIAAPGMDGGNAGAGSVNGNVYNATGGAFIFRGNSNPVVNGSTFATVPSSTIGITPANIAALLNTPQNVTLQASNDIILGNDLIVNNPLGNGGTLTLQAGRSILLNANITTDDGDLFVYANEDLATGVVDAQRDVGAASITMAAGTSINAGAGNVTFRLGNGTGKTNNTSGTISLNNVTAGTIFANSLASTASILTTGVLTATGAGTPLTLASGKDFTNSYGAGALVTPSGRWLIYSDHPALNTMGGLVPDFTLNSCVYAGACGTIPGTGNGALYEYIPTTLGISVNTSRYYGDPNPSLATLQSLFVFTGFQNGDTVAVLDSLPTVTIAGTATATAAAGTSHTLTLSGGSDNYYTYYFLNTSALTILQKPVTATWIAPLSKIYGDPNPSPSYNSFTYTGLANGETIGSINPTFAANFGSTGTTTGAGSYNVTPSWTTSNYSITAPDGIITISKRDITAAWAAALSRNYGDANPTVTSANFNFTGLVNGDLGSVVTPTANYGAITTSSNVGTYTNGVGASFLAANYNITNSPTTTLTINKRNITATVNNTSRAYGDANPTLGWADVTWSNLANSETGSVLDSMAFTVLTPTATSNAGTSQSVTITSFLDNNYNLTGTTAGTFSVAKRDITASVASKSRIYGDVNPTWALGDITWNNLTNGENGGVMDSVALTSPNLVATDNAGTMQAITITSFLDNNYNLTGTTAGTFSITKRDITASVHNASRAYGDANPTLGWADVTWGNLANGENGSVIDGLTVSAPTALATSNAGGSYAINLTGFSDNNYNLTTNNAGILSITKRDITATVNNTSRAYGDANPTLGWSNVTWNNLTNGENGSVMDSVALTSPNLVATDNVGTMQAITITSFLDNNYNLTGTTAGTFSITKRDITASVHNASRAYGDANPTLGWADVTWGNLANGENGSVIDGLTVSAPTALATSNAGGSYAINLTGFSDNNYNLTTNHAGALTINRVPLVLQVANAHRAAQEANPAFEFSLAGLRNGDGLGVLSGVSLATLANQASTPGHYSISASGGTATNYYVSSYLDGELVVGNANSIPSTVEYALNFVPQDWSVSTTSAMVILPQSGNASVATYEAATPSASHLVLVPDVSGSSSAGIAPTHGLIGVTRRLKSLYHLDAINVDNDQAMSI